MISPELKAEALATLADGLRATKRFWEKESASFVAEPDYATRTRNVELILAYAEGRPVERAVKLTGDFTSYSEKLARLCATPEGLRTAQALDLVEKPAAREKASALPAKPPTAATPGEVIDVEPAR